jgi:hypothetical protein
MRKPVLGVVLGGFLGLVDGFSALVSAPDDPGVKAGIAGIVTGATVKGMIGGLITGWYAQRAGTLGASILVGVTVGFAFALLVCVIQELTTHHAYYWQILVPGAFAGLIVGYTTFRFGS